MATLNRLVEEFLDAPPSFLGGGLQEHVGRVYRAAAGVGADRGNLLKASRRHEAVAQALEVEDRHGAADQFAFGVHRKKGSYALCQDVGPQIPNRLLDLGQKVCPAFSSRESVAQKGGWNNESRDEVPRQVAEKRRGW